MKSQSAASLMAESSQRIPYVAGRARSADKHDMADSVISMALTILRTRLKCRNALRSPQDVKNYLCLCGATYADAEVFSVIFLDVQNSVIAHSAMFFGSLTQTSVYPREVVRAALDHAAAGVILSHNHPSGSCTPSRADEFLTQTLKSALALVEVKVLDHIIVAGPDSFSFAERGLL